MSRKRIILGVSLAAAVLLAGFLVFVISVVIMLSGDGIDPLPFDAAAWQNNPATFSHDSMRLRMVDDLLASHPLVGRTRSQVVALLGEPDDVGWRNPDMVYQLGLERGPFAIDSEWLQLHLDKSDVVLDARLMTD